MLQDDSDDMNEGFFLVGKKPAKPRLVRPKLPRESRAPHRPVLTMRVSAEVYAQTVEAAQRSIARSRKKRDTVLSEASPGNGSSAIWTRRSSSRTRL